MKKMQYIFRCECADCGHEWKSIIRKYPPKRCPKCESDNILINEKIEIGMSFY